MQLLRVVAAMFLESPLLNSVRIITHVDVNSKLNATVLTIMQFETAIGRRSQCSPRVVVLTSSKILSLSFRTYATWLHTMILYFAGRINCKCHFMGLLQLVRYIFGQFAWVVRAYLTRYFTCYI